MRAEASRYPGQEQQVMDYFRKNPQAVDRLRGPILEEKVVDFVLELARVTDSTVTAEELAREDEAPASSAQAAPGQSAGEG
jgi:trigger factor